MKVNAWWMRASHNSYLHAIKKNTRHRNQTRPRNWRQSEQNFLRVESTLTMSNWYFISIASNFFYRLIKIDEHIKRINRGTLIREKSVSLQSKVTFVAATIVDSFPFLIGFRFECANSRWNEHALMNLTHGHQIDRNDKLFGRIVFEK